MNRDWGGGAETVSRKNRLPLFREGSTSCGGKGHGSDGCSHFQVSVDGASQLTNNDSAVRLQTAVVITANE